MKDATSCQAKYHQCIIRTRRCSSSYEDADGEEWKEIFEDRLDEEHETLLASIHAAEEERAIMALNEDFENTDFLGVTGH